MPFTFKLSARLARIRRALVAAAIAVACGDHATVTAPDSPVSSDSLSTASLLRQSQIPASITVSPGTAAGGIGDSAYFTAAVKNNSGATLSNSVIWSSSDTTVVRIQPNGLAKASGVGSAKLIATAGSVNGFAQVTVIGPTVATVTVTPGAASGAVNDSAQFAATAMDASGNVITGRAVTWSTTNAAVVTVSATGMGRATGGGTASIVATIDGVKGASAITVAGQAAPVVASVTINPASASGSVGDSALFTATARDASGNIVTGQAVAWSTTNAGVVTVSGAGMGRATGAGSASIAATIGGVRGTSAITVTGAILPPAPAPVASVTVNPSSVSVGVLGTSQLSVTLKDASGNTLTGRTVTWSTNNLLVATVNSTGLVTGVLAGSVAITAASEGVTGSTAVTVNIVPPPTTPASSVWANAPSSYPLIADQPYDSAILNGWDLIWNPVGNGTIVSDPTAPFSPGNVLQVMYPAGFAGGTAPATSVHGLNYARHVYVGMWWKVSANWQGHNSNVNKITFLNTDASGDLILEMYGPPGGPYELRSLPQFATDNRWLTPNRANVPVQLGTWHKIEWQVDCGTPGQADGVVRWWMDGQLIGEWTDVAFPSVGFAEYEQSPTWGGITDVKQHTDYYWFDHVVLRGW